MYRLKSSISLAEVKRRGEEYALKKDRLGFAKFTGDCAERCRIDNSSYIDIGRNCIIREKATLGGHGFGFERDKDGKLYHLYHFGRLIIGHNVWIGSNTNIDRGTVGNTVIGNGTKIDSCVHIAHNCQIGENVLICAGVILCGSVIIKENSFIGINASIRQGVIIGVGAVIGAGSVVLNDVPDGHTIVGNPGGRIKR